MKNVSCQATAISESCLQDDSELVIEYRQWWSQIKHLLRETDCASEKREWKKAMRYLSKAHRITSDFHLKVKK